jgi:hypothetical protein
MISHAKMVCQMRVFTRHSVGSDPQPAPDRWSAWCSSSSRSLAMATSVLTVIHDR